MAGPIALTGATGAVGGRVAHLLAERDLAPRLIVRDATRAPRLPGADVRTAQDMGAAEEMTRALDGVRTLFLVPAAETADRVERHLRAVNAAVAAGVERIVYLSFLAAAPDATFTLARHHWATEERIRAVAPAFTFVRMSLYADFLPKMVSPEGVIAGPADDGRVAAVAREDVAAVAAEVVAGDGHDDRTYDVTGPRAFTMAEAAAELSRVSGRHIVFRDETLEEAYASRAHYGAPDWQVEAWVTTYTAIASGELDVVTDTVARLTGREPATLADVVRAQPGALAHVATG